MNLFLLLALLVPPLVAYSIAPAATVFNQILSAAGFGIALLLQEAHRADSRTVTHLGLAILVVVGALAASAAPLSLVIPAALLLVACVAIAYVACARLLPGQAHATAWWALSLLGGFNLVIALIQVFLPNLADGLLIAKSGLEGRAVGNLRQPNHLSSLALWSAVAVIPLLEWRKLPKAVAALLFAAIVFTVELTASRTGMVGIAVLALWGLVDRRLSRFTRGLLVSGIALYALGWWAMSLWAEAGHHTFGAAARLNESDISGSRWGIWSNTLELIKANPWTGVGFGEFNFAWTLSPFPNRPTAFFDHTHNIVLQLLVELGIPLGGLVVVLLAVALWQAFRRSWTVQDERGVGFRAAFVMVLLIALHSQLEYPLWYAYFLLPTAWLWGLCLGASPQPVDDPAPPSRLAKAFPVVAGSLMIAGSAVAFQQYLVVSRIFEPGRDLRPLDVRIAEGERSIFHGHHAYYAAATVAEDPAEAWDAFRVATHYLLDTRLMIAWADAFAARGDLDRARHIAQRLREFKRPESKEYFAVCDTPPGTGADQPYQCAPPSRAVDWREFRDPALWGVTPTK